MGGDERGLVLEIQGKEVIVLTPQGEFRRVRAPQPCPSVGEEVMLPPVSSWTWSRVKLAMAVMTLVFLAFGFSRIFGFIGLAGKEPYFYVAVDINPSLELILNKQEKVMEAKPLNMDGKVLLEGLNLKEQDVEEALKIISKAALEKGYLRQGEEGFFLISVVPGKGKETEGLDQLAGKLAKVAEGVLQAEHVEVIVRAGTFKVELREQAARLGLSPGKYALYLKALEAGLPVTVEELKEKGALKALRQAGADPQKLWDSTSVNVKGKEKQYLSPVNPEAGSQGLEKENRGNKESLPEKDLPSRPEKRPEEKPPRGISGGEKEAQDVGIVEKRVEGGKSSRRSLEVEEIPERKGGSSGPQDIKVDPRHSGKNVGIPGRPEENKGESIGIKGTK